MTIHSVAVLGGGSAGFMAALTLKRKLPHLKVRVLRSPDIGVIGVGEGTTPAFPRHFFEYLRLKPQQFYAEAEPTWKLGLKLLWGPRPEFYYPFSREFQHRYPELSRNNGFFFANQFPYAGRVSAFMAHDKAFPRQPDGLPQFHNNHAFHIENKKLVGWLEKVARDFGVEVQDTTVTAEVGTARCAVRVAASDATERPASFVPPADSRAGTAQSTLRSGSAPSAPNRPRSATATEDGRDVPAIAALRSETGERIEADLFIDASGFRSELLGRALGEPFLTYTDALFCDRAVIGGWPRTDESIKPYTVAETMDAGWCWQIEHENWINRGYVYASNFISDADALQEFLRKNPKVANEPRLVKFRSGRCARNWVGNVVGVGNAAGFVEPLEATALQIICVQASTLADALIDSLCAPTPTLVQLYNDYNARAWDDIRDFLAIHYKFNTRLDTPFWRACRNDTRLHGAEFLVEFYKENGPSAVAGAQLLHPSNYFEMDGYLALLVGQNVPHGKPFTPPPNEAKIWRDRCMTWSHEAQRALSVKQCLEAIRQPGMKWG